MIVKFSFSIEIETRDDTLSVEDWTDRGFVSSYIEEELICNLSVINVKVA